MPLADIRYLAEHARQKNTGLGAYNVVHLDHAEAFVDAADRAQLPVILQISENAVRYHGSLTPIAKATLQIARDAKIPVVVHLDHAESTTLVYEAVDLGIRSVMFDASTVALQENIDATRKVVEHCHLRGASVEAELGEIGGKNGVHDPAARTDPNEAAAFVAATGVDLLAVAVGSSHAMINRDAVLDTALIKAIRKKVSVPLVLHGSSGVSDSGIQAAIAAGMTKINVSTHLNQLFTETVRSQLVEEPIVVDTRKWFRPALAVLTEEVERLLRLYAKEQPQT